METAHPPDVYHCLVESQQICYFAISQNTPDYYTNRQVYGHCIIYVIVQQVIEQSPVIDIVESFAYLNKHKLKYTVLMRILH